MRAAALAVALLAFPASAAAAPFGERPFRAVTNSATCLRATGAPNELIRWVRGGVEVLTAGADGLTPVATIALGTPNGCPAVASRPNGAAVLAAATKGGISVVVREPGGAWGTPATIAADKAFTPEVAINARGDAIVTWGEYRTDYRLRIHAARRPAGGTFGPAETISSGKTDFGAVSAVTPDGETLVLISGDRVRLTSARMGSAFPPGRVLLPGTGPHSPGLAAAEDGRVLIATAGEKGLVLFEREPGGGEFVRRPAIPGVSSFDDVEIALREGGAAAVTWGLETEVGAMVRAGAGAFGPPVRLQEERAKRPGTDSTTSVSLYAVDDGDPPYEGQSRVRVTLGADGQALLGWGIQDGGVRAATVSATGLVERQTLGTVVRDPAGITPLALADGRRALVWTDNVPIFSEGPVAGRLHFALEGEPASPAAAPEIGVGAPRDRTLRPGQPLDLPIRCRAACDLRGALDENPVEDAGGSRSSAGTVLLRFRPFEQPVAPRNGGRVRLRLRWSAPGSGAVTTRTVSVRLRRLPAPRLPRIEAVRTRRLAGGKIEVRWRADGPAIDAYWSVTGTRVAEPKVPGDIVTVGSAPGGKRRQLRVVLEGARAVRHVHVTLSPRFGRRGRNVVVPVT